MTIATPGKALTSHNAHLVAIFDKHIKNYLLRCNLPLANVAVQTSISESRLFGITHDETAVTDTEKQVLAAWALKQADFA